MRVSMIGCGKLGLPVAVAIAKKFPVVGYDINPKLRCFRLYEHRETGPDGKDDFQDYFQSVCTDTFGSPAGLGFAETLEEAVSGSDIIFVAVQTPHQPQFDGSTRLPLERADFDYTYLIQAVKDIAAYVRPEQTVVVISTVLPGTMRKHILPLLQRKCKFVYNPFFIAMGTCVKPDEIIAGDYEQIGKVSVGTGVVGCSGLGTVKAVFRRPFSGELVRVKARGCLPIEVTPDHPLFIASRKDYYNKPLCDPVWITAGEIKQRDARDKQCDYVIIPRVSGEFDCRSVSLSSFATDVGLKRAAGRGCSTDWPLNEDTCWLLGLYVAEGCSAVKPKAKQCSVRFSLHYKESDLAERVIGILASVGYKASTSKVGDNGRLINCGSSILAKAFRSWCGQGAENKVIPEFILLHKDVELLRSFLNGYMQGDGHCDMRGTSLRWTAVTVSKKLALQLQLAYARLGIFACIDLRSDAGKQWICGILCKVLPSYSVRHEGSSRKSLIRNNWIATGISEVSKISYQGDVCNIETSDNTYLVSNVVVHNCMSNFLNPEFVLIGEEEGNSDVLVNFYRELYGYYDSPMHPDKECQLPIQRMSIESAELTKVAYNTFITCKIGIANTLMEICHKVPGCNVDDITNALCKATNRLISPKYLKGASEEGGACHPRDCIAMSWLSQQLGLSSDLFEDLMSAREWRTEWLAGMIIEESTKRFLPICILGKAFKAETNIVAGSSALLLANILKEGNVEFTQYDPYVDTTYDSDYPIFHGRPRLYFVATNHIFFANQQFPKGSVVLDLWRYLKPQEGVTIIPIGVGEKV